MKTQRIKILTIWATLFLLLVSSTLSAQRMYNHNQRGNNYCQMIPDLTEDQKTKIEDLRIDHIQKMTVYRNQINELRAKKQTLQSSNEENLNEINSVIDKMTNVKNLMMKESAIHYKNVRSLLTDNQKVFFNNRQHCIYGNRRGSGRGNMDGNRQYRRYNSIE